jgi:hypothetical protein
MLLRILIVGISASKVYFLLFSTLQIKAFFLNYFFIYYLFKICIHATNPFPISSVQKLCRTLKIIFGKAFNISIYWCVIATGGFGIFRIFFNGLLGD